MSAENKAGLDGSALSDGFGARSRSARDLAMLVQYVAVAACVWVTLRTIVPGAIEWWQAAAMGGCSGIVATIWVRRK